MAIKAVNFFEVSNLKHVTDNASLSTHSSCNFPKGVEFEREQKFMVVGHRGNGMNVLQSSDSRMKDVKENTILSFNVAGKYPLDYIEFDVQVTKDGCPIVFHDNFIFSEDRGKIYEKRVTELSLSEFLSYGPQREADVLGKTLLRKTKGGQIMNWNVESDDPFCTLQEAFEKVNPCVGFNIELKFDDSVVYGQEYLNRVLENILEVVTCHAKGRSIIFSSFQPDAALLVKKLQTNYPVLFLTNGGNQTFEDVRRNSLEEAIKLCLEGDLQGIVSEVRGIFRNPGAVNKTKEMNLSLMTYGQLNNVAEAVYMQHLMGIDGVIVDFVEEITVAVYKMVKPSISSSADQQNVVDQVETKKPQFSERELSFLLKLIPELIQQ